MREQLALALDHFRRKLEIDLHEAIDKQQFEVHFQPSIRLDDNSVTEWLQLWKDGDSQAISQVMDRIYGDLRAEFDLADRFQSLETKLRSVQEALELVLGVARDRRVFLLEVAVVLLFVLELVVTLLH